MRRNTAPQVTSIAEPASQGKRAPGRCGGDNPGKREENTVIALVIGITAALGFAALGLGVFVLGQPARAPVMRVESEARGLI